MSYVLQPFSFLAGTEVLGTATEGWNLDQLPVHGGPDRSARVLVTFAQPFNGVPLVHLGITGLDVCNKDAARVTVATANVTAQGFEIVVTTWLDSRLWRTQVSWLAIGS
jgi:hypothetical protein